MPMSAKSFSATSRCIVLLISSVCCILCYAFCNYLTHINLILQINEDNFSKVYLVILSFLVFNFPSFNFRLIYFSFLIYFWSEISSVESIQASTIFILWDGCGARIILKKKHIPSFQTCGQKKKVIQYFSHCLIM